MANIMVGGSQGIAMLQEQPQGWELWERTDPEWAGRRVWSLAQVPGAILAGTDAGLLRSVDGGTSWETLLPGDVRVVAPDPADPRRLFAGLQPATAWRSDDGGATWRELTGLGSAEERAGWHLPGATPLETLPLARVSAFAFDPAEPAVVYAGIEIGGIYRSDDGGDSWRACNEDLSSLDVHRLVPHPLEPETIFAATETGVYRSVDRGASWEGRPFETGAGYTRALLALAPDAADDRFVLLAGPAEVDPWGWAEEADGARCRLVRSVDDGATWRPLTFGLPDFFEGLIATIVADPADPHSLVLGSWDGRVFASRDRGLNWAQIAEGLDEVWALLPLEE
jgi:hypothetical protein